MRSTGRGLAALPGIRYRPEGETEYSHANAYLVLDAEGRIIYRHDGLDEPLACRAAAALGKRTRDRETRGESASSP